MRSQASCTSTDTAPYAFEPGSANRRSPISRCTITQNRSTAGSARISTGVATPYGRLATITAGGGSSAARSMSRASANSSRTFGAPAERRRERRLQPAVDLDCVHAGHTRSASQSVSTPTPAPTSTTTSLAGPAQPARHVQHVAVDEEVLAQIAIGRDAELAQPGQRDLGGHSPNTRSAFRSICSASSAAGTPRSRGEHAPA